MTTPQQDNARSYRFLITALDLGVTQLAQVTLLFVKPGVRHHHAGQTQVLFVLDGRLGVETDEQAWLLGPGDRCVLPADKSHRTTPLPGQERVELLDLRVATSLATALGAYVASLPTGVGSGVCEPLRDIAERLAAHIGGGGKPRQATLAAAAWSLLALYETPVEADAPRPDPEDARLKYADVLMRDHLDVPLSIETLAARVNLSSSRLRQLMMQHYGVPPQERYLQLRMEKARLFVESSTLSMKEIAKVCGFSNPDYFSRAFGAWAGATPTQVRRQAQAQRSGDAATGGEAGGPGGVDGAGAEG